MREREQRGKRLIWVLGSIPITEMGNGDMGEAKDERWGERGLGEVHWKGVKKCCYLF